MRHFLSLIVIFVLSLASTSDARADSLRVTIFDADGQSTSGPLQDWSADSIRLATADKRSWKWRDVVTVRFDDRSAPAAPRGSAIWLANGDRLIARGIGIADEQLKFRWPKVAGELDALLPIEAVRGLSLALPHAREPRDQLAAWLLDRKDSRDELRLANGDRIAGELTDWAGEILTLTTAAAELKLREAEVREIAFNTDLVTLREPTTLRWLVELSDGSRVTLVAERSQFRDGVLNATHVTGATWRIPVEVICELRVLGGRTVFLSDLIPAASEQTPFLAGAREWPMRRDRAVSGSPLRLASREYAKGLGMHSRAVVTYSLTKQDRHFTARVGLDDSTTGPGTALCAVELDGRQVFVAERLSRTTGPQQLPLIDGSQAKRLTLIVDYGDLGDLQGHVNWCDAVLLRVP